MKTSSIDVTLCNTSVMRLQNVCTSLRDKKKLCSDCYSILLLIHNGKDPITEVHFTTGIRYFFSLDYVGMY